MTSHCFHRVFICWVLLLVVAAFAQAPQPSQASLSAKDRKDVFEFVWTVVNEKYYDTKTNGVNWKEARKLYKDRVEFAQTDAEFYQALQLDRKSVV